MFVYLCVYVAVPGEPLGADPEHAQEPLVWAVHPASVRDIRGFPLWCYSAHSSTHISPHSYARYGLSTARCLLSSLWLLRRSWGRFLAKRANGHTCSVMLCSVVILFLSVTCVMGLNGTFCWEDDCLTAGWPKLDPLELNSLNRGTNYPNVGIYVANCLLVYFWAYQKFTFASYVSK